MKPRYDDLMYCAGGLCVKGKTAGTGFPMWYCEIGPQDQDELCKYWGLARCSIHYERF